MTHTIPAAQHSMNDVIESMDYLIENISQIRGFYEDFKEKNTGLGKGITDTSSLSDLQFAHQYGPYLIAMSQMMKQKAAHFPVYSNPSKNNSLNW